MFITQAGSFQVLVDPTQCVVGLRVDPLSGESFFIPMTATTATEVATQLFGAANA
jgi:hypothetical protein